MAQLLWRFVNRSVNKKNILSLRSDIFLKEAEHLNNEEIGELGRAIVNYNFGRDVGDLSKIVNLVFSRMRDEWEKYLKRSNTNKSNGLKGRRPKCDLVIELPEVELPNFIDKELWQQFWKMRIEKKLPKATQITIDNNLTKLIKFHSEGIDANDALLNSIELGYRGIFPRNKQPSTKNSSTSKSQATIDAIDSILAESKVEKYQSETI